MPKALASSHPSSFLPSCEPGSNLAAAAKFDARREGKQQELPRRGSHTGAFSLCQRLASARTPSLWARQLVAPSAVASGCPPALLMLLRAKLWLPSFLLLLRFSHCRAPQWRTLVRHLYGRPARVIISSRSLRARLTGRAWLVRPDERRKVGIKAI